MAEGHCNCEGVKVKIPAMPGNSIICYCANCRRAGSSAFSVIYLFDKSEIEIQDPTGLLKTYTDSKTISGNTVYRQFCSNCGSPVASLLGLDSPKVALKAGLFDHIPDPVHEAFDQDKPTWMKIIKPGNEEEKL